MSFSRIRGRRLASKSQALLPICLRASRTVGSMGSVPMKTVAQPVTMTPPWTVVSPSLAAGLPPISTVGSPVAMASGGPMQAAWSPTRAAGIPPTQYGWAAPQDGPPTCGFGPGSTWGQVCISPIRAAGCDIARNGRTVDLDEGLYDPRRCRSG